MALAVAVERLLREPAPTPSEATTETGIGARELRGDLDAIVARALAKSPADRYPSVGALQADLRRHLDGEPVRARSGARAYRLGRFLKRHRYAVASTGLVVGALAAGLAGTAWQAREAARERDVARAEAARADAVRDSVLLMFREAGEARGEGEITAKQVLERAAARLVALDAAEVAQRQPVFQALGELYAALDDFEGAAPIYRHYLASAGAAADPEVRAQVQHNLAIAETRLGNAEVARDLLR
ncbi:MAG: hypothetical protein LW860_17060 [Xanthomonadaceae bacterium]|nr:hypothetical protein [Xanthomonadaceae bacterium]